MKHPTPVFHGTEAQAKRLLEAVHHQCQSGSACQDKNCGAHQCLLDQRFLDGVLFMRDRLIQLQHEEFDDPNACLHP